MDVAAGLSIGYTFALLKNKEEEVDQGGSSYKASVLQIGQIANLSNVIGPLANEIPYAPLQFVMTTCNTILPFASMAVCPLAAAVKEGHYEQGVKILQSATGEGQLSRLTSNLPEKLSERSIQVFNFLADNTGNAVRVAMLVGAVALPFVCSAYLAGAMLVPIAYEAIDSRGFVPRKISLFMEKYMPAGIQMCTLIGCGPLSQLLSIASLASYFPCVNQAIHKKINQLTSHYLGLTGPTLEEIDAPVKTYKELSFEEIKKILNGDDLEYEINSSHCSKKIYEDGELSEERDFNKYLELFQAVAWEQRYGILKQKFRDDDRFIKFLKKTFPTTSNEDIYGNFEKYLEKLALEAKKTKELYLADKLREQMKHLVKILHGQERAKGSQKDTEDAIYNCSKILHYLLSLDSASYIEKEDILLKLAIEGGEYCARGIKRASGEILSSIIRGGLDKNEGFDPIKDYEWKIGQQLEQLRLTILETIYQKIIETMVRLAREGSEVKVFLDQETTDPEAVAIAQDVHTIDLYRLYLTLGFYPLNENERSAFGMNELVLWEIYGPIRQEMYGIYHARLNECFAEVGEIHFANYLRLAFQSNSSLSEEEREMLLDMYSECNEGKWSIWSTKEKFYRLFFVIQGVLRKQKIYEEDWVELPADEFKLSEEESKEWEFI